MRFTAAPVLAAGVHLPLELLIAGVGFIVAYMPPLPHRHPLAAPAPRGNPESCMVNQVGTWSRGLQALAFWCQSVSQQ